MWQSTVLTIKDVATVHGTDTNQSPHRWVSTSPAGGD